MDSEIFLESLQGLYKLVLAFQEASTRVGSKCEPLPSLIMARVFSWEKASLYTSFGGQCVIDVCYSQDPGGKGDILSGKAVRIP